VLGKKLGVLLSVGGKIDPTFTQTVDGAMRSVDRMIKKTQDAVNINKSAQYHNKAMRGLGNTANTTSGLWQNVGRSIMLPVRNLGLLAIAGATALVAMGVKTAKLGTEIYNMSKKIGLSSQSLSEMAYAFDQNGASISDLETGLKRMNMLTAKAVKGNKEAKETFYRLGINIRDVNGNVKDSETLLLEASDMFKKMGENGADEWAK
jgi:tellurite resistance protein